ncbi:putative peptidoglycan binding protein [Streptomyces sp. TLI_55]|uniref:L,D-transpeptidase family protein n=1 Tax=Streptomyces sp. TLI_55 TaxID=1938861 RepID=UPI000BDCFBB3|nr:L,D-transpeptidase family protein [Streptomyces sp. TLI_55]SNX58369.1 putative peptidoglycan binding protein [Streptomyces sp. TLI_55]
MRISRPLRTATSTLLAGLLPLALAAPATAAPAPCTTGTGPYQRELERHLRLTVDGRQSPADCEAIRAFQSRNGVGPADGYAGLATYRTMLVVEARPNPNAAGRCPVRAYRVACVDLDRQLMWVQDGRRVVFAPVPIRSGRDGYETRTGWHTVYWREIDHYSDLYEAPMPYAQFFDEGQAFHGSNGDLYSGGSHGCVNLRLDDARRLWDTLAENDAVFVWGVKPGTERTLRPTAPSPAAHTPPPTPGAR